MSGKTPKMPRILITGATGNVGRAVLQAFSGKSKDVEVRAGVRSVEKDQVYGFPTVAFEFGDDHSVDIALNDCDILFLLRPPQLTDIARYFEPLIASAKKNRVQHIVFLSVQGAEKSSVIPHHKIEKLILDSGLSYTFLRPAYFMQNFTTTLLEDIVENHRIYLPAGSAQFTVIDVADVGKVAAEILKNPVPHNGKAYALTNEEQLSFEEMTAMIREETRLPVTYTSPNLLSFFINKRKKGLSTGYIFVMIMLHYLPRFYTTPETTNFVETITGRPATSFRAFIRKHRKLFQPV
jgi:uncharacterized protein YbjT (DUF2867 family)